MTSWGVQFSTGDQGPNKRLFFMSSYSSCPGRKGTKISSETHCAGVRHNGDGYGTEVFKCEDCPWTTSYQYDEAADTYYYETRGWEVKAPAPAPATPLTPALIVKYERVKRLVSEEQARENMKLDGILPDDIDKFFTG